LIVLIEAISATSLKFDENLFVRSERETFAGGAKNLRVRRKFVELILDLISP
jgi:hypothetical protein